MMMRANVEKLDLDQGGYMSAFAAACGWNCCVFSTVRYARLSGCVGVWCSCSLRRCSEIC